MTLLAKMMLATIVHLHAVDAICGGVLEPQGHAAPKAEHEIPSA